MIEHDVIFDYNMTDEEILAYKIGLSWISLTEKIFPNYRHSARYPKKGDPRKSSLFRYSWKLMNETKGLVKQSEYDLYITAQLQMLKSIQIGNQYPNITPSCLVGAKAWQRWKTWKRKLDNIGKTKTLKDVNLDKPELNTVKLEIDKSRTFLIKKINQYLEDNFKAKAKDVERWLSQGLISGFYAAHSPWYKRYCNLDVDLSFYTVDNDTQAYFKLIFPEEFA